MPILPPMIYVITIYTNAGALPAYFADSPPDTEAIEEAILIIRRVVCRKAYLRYD